MSIDNVHRGAYQNDVDQEVTSFANQDPWNSGYSFDNERQENVRDYAFDLAEIERSPEAYRAILEQQDADTQLVREILESRRGLAGVWNTAYNNCVGRFAATAAVGFGLRTGVHAVAGDALNRFSGGLYGGVMGAFWGWIRGKNQEESAATWMAEMGILKRNNQEMYRLSDDQAYMALGLLSNAVKKRRVRGSAPVKMEMANKIHLLKCMLSDRAMLAREHGRTMNPILANIEGQLNLSAEEQKNITDLAADDYEELFTEILRKKGKKTAWTAVKAGAFGAVLGGTLGYALRAAGDFVGTEQGKEWLGHHPVWNKVNDWFGGILGSGGHEHADIGFDSGGDVDQQLQERMEQLRGGPLQDDIALHNENLEVMENFSSDPLRAEPVPGEHLTSGGPDSALAHFGRLYQENPLHPHGLQPGELAEVQGMIQNDQLHDLVDLANHRNIDLTLPTSTGEPVAQLIMDNKEAFLRLPVDVQNFVLSHPSVASEFLQANAEAPAEFLSGLSAKLNDVMAMTAVDTSKEQVMAGLIAGGALFLAGDIAKSQWEGKKQSLLKEARESNRNDMIEHNRRVLDENRQQAMTMLAPGRSLRFPHLPPGYTLPAGRSDVFTIESIDPVSGIINFRWANEDRAARAAGADPHPRIRYQDLMNPDNTLNEQRVCPVTETEDSSAEQNRERLDQNLETSRELLHGAIVRFAGMPGVARTRQFEVQRILPNRDLLLRPLLGTTAPPHVNMDQIIDAENNLLPNLVEFVRLGRPAAEAGAPAPAEPVEEVNLTMYQNMVNAGTPVSGTLESGAGGRRYFRGTFGAPSKNRRVMIENRALGDGLPDGFNVEIIPQEAKAVNNEPALGVRLIHQYTGGGPAGPRYALTEHLNDKAKNSLVTALKNSATGGKKIAIYDPRTNLFMQFDSYSAPNFSFTDESGTQQSFDEATLKSMDIYEFKRV